MGPYSPFGSITSEAYRTAGPEYLQQIQNSCTHMKLNTRRRRSREGVSWHSLAISCHALESLLRMVKGGTVNACLKQEASNSPGLLFCQRLRLVLQCLTCSSSR